MDDKIRESLKQFSILNYSECKDYNAKQWATHLSLNINKYTKGQPSDLSLFVRLGILYGGIPDEWKKNVEHNFSKVVKRLNNKRPVIPILKDSICSTEGEDKKNKIEVSINLSFTDDVLIKELLSIITEARKEKSITPSISSLKKAERAYTESEIASWHRHGVLPFIHLTIWLKKNNAKLSLQEIGVVIFGDPYTSYEKKISRLKKEVDGLMTAEQIHLLICMD